jgi:actin-like ATPase involved in cell morphogenesis
MTVAVDLGSSAVKVAGGADSSVLLEHPVDPELAARVGTTVPLTRRDGSLVITQAPHDAYVRAVAAALDGMAAESVAIVAPDWWSKRAREVVEQTLEAHASGPFQLVSPAVAAISASRERHRLPTTVAVLDIGAESSSATVLTDVDGVYRVVGRPAVLHGQAGNDIDRRLMQHVLGWLSADGHGYEPTDSEIAAAGESLLTQVKAAKERLSARPAATLTPDLPGANAELRLVRSEFDEVVRGTVDAIVAMLKASIETNDSEGAEAVLLIGGSASIPLVTQVISVEVGLPVVLDNDPATLAVRGAATMEMPAAPQRKGWRRRKGGAGTARNVFDLNNAPAPDSEPYLDSLPSPALEPRPEPRVEAKAARLGSFIERSRREAAATRSESAPQEPLHLMVETGDASWPNRTARWTSAPEGSGWNSARHTYVDEQGQFRLWVNDRDYEVDMGTELASTSVTVLLIGLHVFVTLTETGELLREMRLNPEHDFRPESSTAEHSSPGQV